MNMKTDKKRVELQRGTKPSDLTEKLHKVLFPMQQSFLKKRCVEFEKKHPHLSK